MANRPIVDRLQQQYAGRVRVVRVDLLTPAGRELGARYGFDVTPFFVGFNARGSVVWTQRGTMPSSAMLDRLIQG